METIALKSLLARSKSRLGVTGRAGNTGLARTVDRVQSRRNLMDERFFSALLPATLLVVDAAILLAGDPVAAAELESLPREKRRTFLDAVLAAGIPCLAVAGVNKIPEFLADFAERTSTVVLGSRFDEHLLTSRLTALWREKLHRRVSLQGALVNVWGWGILIAGESGSGKTTLALELARRGHQWIADDAVEIEKEPDGRLSGRSQAAVKNLLEIKGSGVLSVRDILPPGSIADTTPVDMIADIRQDARRCVSTSSLGRQSRIIMGVRLPRLRIPRSGNRCGQIENAVRIMSEAGAA